MSTDKMTFICETDIIDKIDIILRQTDYSKEVAREKLIKNDLDHIKVIKEYHGIFEKKEPEIKSLQQEIYKQIRLRMNDSMRIYNKKQEEKLEKDINDNNIKI
jgi:hypothetical protein